MAFAYLVLHRARPIRRDQLVEAIWPGGEAGNSSALPPVLSRLRKALAPVTLEGRDALTLGLPEPAWIDVEVARERLRKAHQTDDDASAVEASREVAALAAAGLLPGLEMAALDDLRAAVDDLRVDAFDLTARRAVEFDPALAEEAARQAIAAAPFRESSWAALIGALRARGNAAEAIRAYDELRALLRDELGITPGAELIALHASLVSGQPAPRASQGRNNGGAPAESTAPRAEVAPAGGTTTHSGAARPGGTLDVPVDLVERDAELRAVHRALGHIDGGVLLIEGPAGIGKTRLLTELRQRAAGSRRVLSARAGLPEREFGFGVVRQLLDAAADPELLAGAAAPARAVLSDVGSYEGTFPVFEALFRLLERITADGPLLLCIDDLQWSDPASLRWVAYLARRISPLPVLLAATIRTGEPDVEDALLSEIGSEPYTVALRPKPLSPGGTAQLVRERLGDDADASFTGACQEVTAGNPLLLRALLSALEGEGVVPDAASADAVRSIGSRAVGQAVRLRLARLPSPAGAVARAIAVLGEAPEVPSVAALSGTTEPEAARAVDALARADIIRSDEPLGFVHPLVREAVYGELPAAARALEHDRAARLLAGFGAAPERVAAQLLLAPRRADAWVVDRLREAADIALRRGAPEAAMAMLERAQTEPPPPDQQAELALQLGGSAAYLRGPAGVEPLERAYAGLTDPIQRGRAAVRLSHLLLFVRSPQEGVALARLASTELPPGSDDLRDALRAITLVGAAFGVGDASEFGELGDVRAGPRGRGPGGRALTAMTGFAVAVSCGPAAEASALVREAFSAPGLDAVELTATVAVGTAALALGDPAEGLVGIERYAEHAQRQGEILGSIGADLWGGITNLWAGDVPAAIASLERAHERERLWGTKLDAVMAYSAAWTALAQLERGDPLAQVAATLHRVHADDPRPDGARFWLASAAELALASGNAEEAIEITHRLEHSRPADTHPVWAPWRTLRARSLASLGNGDEARRLAAEELELARRVGAPWVVGRGLRLLAELEGAAGVDHAAEAVSLLRGANARLELAKAQLALARARVAAGDRPGAEAARAEAATIAAACGAHGLAARARA